ncbi:MAG TPA: SCP2 sterol-binding domain-containing protein [Burkholderiales bacterium]|nr:SCP2 sterol-binding domain-containing protein [Burkholderiales bacterium]
MKIPAVPRTIGKLLAALPQYPHSVMMSVLSTLLVRDPFAPLDAERIRGKVVCLNVRDAGIRIKMRIGRDGYLPCHDSTEPHVTVSAGVREFLLLALRKEDPDTLFFDRRLCVEGDTELGLIVKNALDRIEPPIPARLLQLLRDHLS